MFIAEGGSGSGFYAGMDVIALGEDNFQAEVTDSEDIWMVSAGKGKCSLQHLWLLDGSYDILLIKRCGGGCAGSRLRQGKQIRLD